MRRCAFGLKAGKQMYGTFAMEPALRFSAQSRKRRSALRFLMSCVMSNFVVACATLLSEGRGKKTSKERKGKFNDEHKREYHTRIQKPRYDNNLLRSVLDIWAQKGQTIVFCLHFALFFLFLSLSPRIKAANWLWVPVWLPSS